MTSFNNFKKRFFSISKNKNEQTASTSADMDKYGEFAWAAYQSKEIRIQSTPNGFTYLEDDSSPEIAVYKDESSGQIIVSSRGTTLSLKSDVTGNIEDKLNANQISGTSSFLMQLGEGLSTSAKDLSTDVMLGFGMNHITSRYKDLNKSVKELISKYGKENLVLTGHSLGGRLAEDVAIQNDVESHVFNSGTSPVDVLKLDTKHVHYRVDGDVISANTTRGNDVVIKADKSKGSAHTIDQFAGKFQGNVISNGVKVENIVGAKRKRDDSTNLNEPAPIHTTGFVRRAATIQQVV